MSAKAFEICVQCLKNEEIFRHDSTSYQILVDRQFLIALIIIISSGSSSTDLDTLKLPSEQCRYSRSKSKLSVDITEDMLIWFISALRQRFTKLHVSLSLNFLHLFVAWFRRTLLSNGSQWSPAFRLYFFHNTGTLFFSIQRGSHH